MPCDVMQRTRQQQIEREKMLDMLQDMIERGLVQLQWNDDGTVGIVGWDELPFKGGWEEACILAAMTRRECSEYEELMNELGVTAQQIVEIHGH